KAGESTAETKTARLPQFNAYILGGESLTPIDFTIPRGALGVYPSTGPIPAQNATISTPQNFNALIYASAAQPVTQQRKIGLAIRESRVGEEMAEESLRQKKQDTAHQVKEAYYQIVQTQTQISSAQESLKYLTELAAVTDRNLAEQTVLKSDSLNVKAKLSQTRYQLLVLQDTLASQREALNRLLGRDLATDFSVEDQPMPTPEELDLGAARREASEKRSEIREARLQTKKTELDIRREHAEYLPDISLQLSYISLPNISFAPKNILSAGFLLQWQPFDWGQKKHKLEELKSTSKQAVLSAQDAEQQVLLDVNQKFRKLMEARALLDTQAAVQDTEREKLRVTMNQYQQKSALLADLLQEQTLVAQADNQYQQALAGFWTAKAGFDHAVGRD
ncbi:MAG TPA: TolC family protein, partial [Bryobacteraceae bacterium]|nr:TolC family protein [Bryobacteraceae bacterium]